MMLRTKKCFRWSQMRRSFQSMSAAPPLLFPASNVCLHLDKGHPCSFHHPLVLHARQFTFWSPKATEWSKAVSEAEKIVGYPTSFMSLRCLLSDELSNVAQQMRKLVGTKHPLLKTARKFFYDGNHSIQTRGLLVLLVSKAAGSGPDTQTETMISGIYPRQRSLAEIIEMINTANLIHRGVVNLDDVQPSDGSVQDMHFGNKMSVLSGDYLLATASTGLAALNDIRVIELISGAIGELVEAEFTGDTDVLGNPVLSSRPAGLEDWERHAYLSSAGLIANSCKAAMMLANHDEQRQQLAYDFGKHTALAHQLKDDLQPFTSDGGVPPSVRAAPAILYVRQHLEEACRIGLVDNPNLDLGKLRREVRASGALEESKTLLDQHSRQALASLHQLAPSQARSALENIVHAISVL